MWADERKRFYRVLMFDEREEYDAMIDRLAGASSAAAINNRGLAYAEIGQVDEAFEDFAAAMEIDPAAAVPYINRGDLLRRGGDLEGAVSDYVQAIARDPRDPYFRRTCAHVLHELGRFDEAVTEYDAVIALQPEVEQDRLNRERAVAGLPPLE